MSRIVKVDLNDRLEELRNQKIPEAEDEVSEFVSEVEQEYGRFEDVPEEHRVVYDELEENRVELTGEANVIEKTLSRWEGGEFEISALTLGQIAQLQDRVSASTSSETNVTRDGAALTETLNQGIISQPSGAPTRTDPDTGIEKPNPADYPQAVGEYLFEKINALNTTGEQSMGNMSLRERMN